MNVKKRAWEVIDETQALRALAGHSTWDEFEMNRRGRAAELVQWCSIDHTKRGFEIGSGEGTVARLLSNRCLGLDCNDVSESFLDLARKNCSGCSNVAFHLIGMDYLDHLPADTYDFGYSLNVFIHFNPYDMFHYLAAVGRILKPSGCFYFDACTIGADTMPSFREHAEAYRANPENIHGLLNFNDPKLIKTLAGDAGLKLSRRSRLPGGGWLKILVTR